MVNRCWRLAVAFVEVSGFHLGSIFLHRCYDGFTKQPSEGLMIGATKKCLKCRHSRCGWRIERQYIWPCRLALVTVGLERIAMIELPTIIIARLWSEYLRNVQILLSVTTVLQTTKHFFCNLYSRGNRC